VSEGYRGTRGSPILVGWCITWLSFGFAVGDFIYAWIWANDGKRRFIYPLGGIRIDRLAGSSVYENI
jgi:hypothetical protein